YERSGNQLCVEPPEPFALQSVGFWIQAVMSNKRFRSTKRIEGCDVPCGEAQAVAFVWRHNRNLFAGDLPGRCHSSDQALVVTANVCSTRSHRAFHARAARQAQSVTWPASALPLHRIDQVWPEATRGCDEWRAAAV